VATPSDIYLSIIFDHTLDCSRIDIDSSRKEEIGREAKRLIDWGRSRFLTQMGFTAELKFYADTDVTPENLLIRGVAKPH